MNRSHSRSDRARGGQSGSLPEEDKNFLNFHTNQFDQSRNSGHDLSDYGSPPWDYRSNDFIPNGNYGNFPGSLANSNSYDHLPGQGRGFPQGSTLACNFMSPHMVPIVGNYANLPEIHHRSNDSTPATKYHSSDLQAKNRPLSRSSDRQHSRTASSHSDINYSAMDSPTDRPSSNSTMIPKKCCSISQLETIAVECIGAVGSRGDHVSLESIEKALLEATESTSLRDLGIHKITQLKPVYEHNRLLTAVNSLLEAFCRSAAIVTLYDVSEFMKGSKGFDLEMIPSLGPIWKLPVVTVLFGDLSGLTEIPEYPSARLYSVLAGYIKNSNKWNVQMSLEEILKEFCSKFGISDPKCMGVRINSLPLAVAVARKSCSFHSRLAHKAREEVESSFFKEITNDMMAMCQELKLEVSGRENPLQTTKLFKDSLVDMDPVGAVSKMLNIYGEILGALSLKKPKPLKTYLTQLCMRAGGGSNIPFPPNRALSVASDGAKHLVVHLKSHKVLGFLLYAAIYATIQGRNYEQATNDILAALMRYRDTPKAQRSKKKDKKFKNMNKYLRNKRQQSQDSDIEVIYLDDGPPLAEHLGRTDVFKLKDGDANELKGVKSEGVDADGSSDDDAGEDNDDDLWQISDDPERRHILEELKSKFLQYLDQYSSLNLDGPDSSSSSMELMDDSPVGYQSFWHKLARIERTICPDFTSNKFRQLKYRSMVDFIAHNPDIASVLTGLEGPEKSTNEHEFDHRDSGKSGDRYSVEPGLFLDFIIQCGWSTSSTLDQLKLMIGRACDFFDISGPAEAGFEDSVGSLDQKLRETFHSDRGSTGHSLSSMALSGGIANIAAISFVSSDANNATATNHSSANNKGFQHICNAVAASETDAFLCLQSCPLMEDLAHWSEWESRFQPTFGPIREFLAHRAAKCRSVTINPFGNLGDKLGADEIDECEEIEMEIDIAGLEVAPGSFLRVLQRSASPQSVRSALRSRNARLFVGHLCSLAAAFRSIDLLPISLLSEDVRREFEKWIDLDACNSLDSEKMKRSSCFVTLKLFVLDCLKLMPSELRLSVGYKLLVKPFLSVLNIDDQNKSNTNFSNVAVEHLLGSFKPSNEIYRQILNDVGRSMNMPFLVVSAEQFYNQPQAVELVENLDLVDDDSSDDEQQSGESEAASSDDDEDDENENDDIENGVAGKLEEVVDLVAQKMYKLRSEENENCSVFREGMDIEYENIVDDNLLKARALDTNNTAYVETQSRGKLAANKLIDVNNIKKIEDNHDESVDESDSTKLMNVIERIRREEFGLGVEMGEVSRKLLETQHLRLGRSLERLSQDLYSKDTHFVLELIQNADDNSYPPDVTPTLWFRLEEDQIIVKNNEVGFSEANVRALCDVGMSTKGKHKYGYIGQKGIGFKSVFKITDAPEIHSNEFKFKFDLESGPMGYILPTPVEPLEESTVLDGRGGRWTTVVRLPLKATFLSKKRSFLLKLFDDIQPTMLLFLHRLERIVVENCITNETITISKSVTSEAGGLITISTSGGESQEWLCVHEPVDVSKLSSAVKSGTEVESTEITLAFPVPSLESAAALSHFSSSQSCNSFSSFSDFDHQSVGKFQQISLPQQSVFAFLPLRPFGFKFIIQADFDIPSSREDIDHDSAWNQWILDHVAGAFVGCLREFVKLKIFPHPRDSIRYFCHFIPNKNDVVGSFKSVVFGVIQRLQTEAWLPVMSIKDCGFKDEKCDSGVEIAVISSDSCRENDRQLFNSLKMPTECLVCKDPLLTSLVSPSSLYEFLNLYYLDPSIGSVLDAPLCYSLSIHFFDSHHIVEVLRHLSRKILLQDHNEVSAVKSPGSLDQLAADVAKLCYALTLYLPQDAAGRRRIIDEFRRLKLIQLRNGKFGSFSETQIYLPCRKEDRLSDSMLFALRDSAMIAENFANGLNEHQRLTVLQFLTECGAKYATLSDILTNIVLPYFCNEIWKRVENQICDRSDLAKFSEDGLVCVRYLCILIEAWMRKELEMSELEKFDLVILTSHGFKNPKINRIYFSSGYQPKYDLTKMFSSVDWVMVSAKAYLSYFGLNLIPDIRNFFKFLGVVECFEVEKTVIPSENSPMSTVVVDFKSSEIESILSSNDRAQQTSLFIYLNEEWNNCNFHLAAAKYEINKTILSENSDNLSKCLDKGDKLGPSSFAEALRFYQWIPATVTDPVTASSDTIWASPVDLFCDRDSVEVKKLLRDLVPRMKSVLEPHRLNPGFLEALNIRNSVDFQLVWDYFVKWSKDPIGFRTSKVHIEALYDYFNQAHLESQNKLQEMKCIWIPESCDPKPPDSKIVLGKFHPPSEFIWSDVTGQFGSNRKLLAQWMGSGLRCVLDTIYPAKFSEFFINCCGVREAPSIKDWMNLISVLVKTSSFDSSFRSVIVGWEHLVKTYAAGSIPIQDLQELRDWSKAKQIIPCKLMHNDKLGYLSVRDSPPLIADNADLAKYFRGKVGFVLMLRLKTSTTPETGKDDQFLTLLKALGIKCLGEVVKEDLVTQLMEPFPEGQIDLRTIFPPIQRYMSHLMRRVYASLVETSIGETIECMKCFEIEKLEIALRLCDREVAPVVKSKQIYIHCHKGEEPEPGEIASLDKLANRIVSVYIVKGARDRKDFSSLLTGRLFDFLKSFLPDNLELEQSFRFWLSLLARSIREPGGVDRLMYDIPQLDGPEQEWIPTTVFPPRPAPIPLLLNREPILVQDRPPSAINSCSNTSFPAQSQPTKIKSTGPTQYPSPLPDQVRPNMTSYNGPVGSGGQLGGVGSFPRSRNQNLSVIESDEQLRRNIETNTKVPTLDKSFAGSFGSGLIGGSGTLVSSEVNREKLSNQLTDTGGTADDQPPPEDDGITEKDNKEFEAQAAVGGESSEQQVEAGERTIAVVGKLPNDHLPIATLPHSSSGLDDGNPLKRQLPNAANDDPDCGEPEGKKARVEASSSSAATEPSQPALTEEQILERIAAPNQRSNLVPVQMEATEEPWKTFKPVVDITQRLEKVDFDWSKYHTGRPKANKSESDNDSANRPIGKEGEELVYELLRQQYAQELGVTVSWANSKGEELLPYDIAIERIVEGVEQREFIEVKSSVSHGLKPVSISVRQLQFALLNADRFHLYRVYGVGSDEVRIGKIERFGSMLQDKGVTMYLVL